jgi:hypothetical protein
MFGPPHQFEFEQRQPHRAPSLRHPGQFVEVMGEGLSKVMIRSRPASGFVARHSEGASPPLRPTPPLKPKSASRAFIPFGRAAKGRLTRSPRGPCMTALCAFETFEAAKRLILEGTHT